MLKSGKMGNEESQYRKIDIDEDTLAVSEIWSLHNAKDVDGNAVSSAFISQSNPVGKPTALEKLTKNLMVHRHPCIVKYISSWNRNDKLYLITERVQPLTLVIGTQSTLQICIGLHSILSALIFLHEQAHSSHNNVCCASIYVTPEGIWKLGGLEYLMRFSEITSSYLKDSRNSRYEKAIPPEEDSLTPSSKINAKAIDEYAFGVLVEELLKRKPNDDLPFLLEFQEYCNKQLRNSNPNNRIHLSEIFQHPFFNHTFIKISKFLFDLPIKSNHEKEEFFRDLTEQLFMLPEDVTASQLSSLLLSRVVLLDSTAQKHLLPVVLQPKMDEKGDSSALFSEDVFKRHIIPKLLKIFCVRDVQIRLILLKNFHSFCNVFTLEQLRNHILPELLVGIKDVNDDLVSMTLKALSQLVLLLGAATVIGGKRGKLFTDGRPKSLVPEPSYDKTKRSNVTAQNAPSPIITTSGGSFDRNGLPERPSPDGGEDKSSATCHQSECDTEHWSDWDLPTEKNSPEKSPETGTEPSVENRSEAVVRSGNGSDIIFLDIKSTTTENGPGGDIDFFHDMEPVISKTQVLSIHPSKTKFDVEADENGSNWEGWGEDWELGEDKL